nr:iron-containing alcohol dehydrogenase [Sciscionella marina]
MSLHHKLCHILGGTFDLPQAPTHVVVLPHVAAFNLPTAPAANAALSRALRTDHPATALADLATAAGAPRSLAELGLRKADLPEVIQQVLAQPYATPDPRRPRRAPHRSPFRVPPATGRPRVVRCEPQIGEGLVGRGRDEHPGLVTSQ